MPEKSGTKPKADKPAVETLVIHGQAIEAGENSVVGINVAKLPSATNMQMDIFGISLSWL